MEVEKVYSQNVHHGLNVKRTRIKKGMKQDELAFEANTTQQNVSLYEAKRVIEREMLERFAKALNVPVEELEYMDEEGKTVIFESNTITNENTFENNDNVSTEIGYLGEGSSQKNSTNNFNPIEKIIQIYDEKTALYERPLTADKEKIEQLEQQVLDLKQKLSEK